MDEFIPTKKSSKTWDNSSVCSNKAKNIKAYVGFEKDELKDSTTSELLQLKNTVFAYLKSNSQKFKNSEYISLYKRIIEELKNRKLQKEEEIKSNTKVHEEKRGHISNRSDQIISSSCLNFDSVESAKNSFLGRKKNYSEGTFDFNIPSFFNDFEGSKKEIQKEFKKAKKNSLQESGIDSETEYGVDRALKSLDKVIKEQCIIKGKPILII